MVKVNKQRMWRIKVALAAYAYEIENKPIISDAEYDELCKKINVKKKTGRLDEWFKENYSSDTGQWIHRHPELDKIKQLYTRLYA